MAQIFANNAKSVLSASIGTASTTIPVADATSFPTLTGADFALVTLQYQTSIEIVQIVAPGKTGNNLIVGARAQEGTAAQTFPLGANVQGRITAGSLGLIQSNTIVAGDIATTIHNAGVKVGPADADEFGYSDSAAAFGLKKFTWASLKAALLSYFSTLTGTWAISTTGNAGMATTATTATNATNQSGGTVAATTISASGLISANGGQIKFPATQNPSADANTLDDYEEGTLTATVGGTATYSDSGGVYTKIGRMVYFTVVCSVNVLGTGSNFSITLTGLPALPVNFDSSNDIYPCSALLSNAAISVVDYVAYMSSNSVAIGHKTAASTNFTYGGAIGNGTVILLSGAYMSAS